METQTTMLPTTLIVLRHSPHDERWLAEGLDVALVGAVFGQEVKLLFMGQGVMSLIPGQHDTLGKPLSTSAILESLAMYGIKELLVPSNELAKLNIGQNDMMAGVSVIDDDQLRACFSKASHVLTF